jgi:hypothetical protein
MFHTFTCCCAYSFVIRKECGPILARLINLLSGESTVDLAMLRSAGTIEGVSTFPEEDPPLLNDFENFAHFS